MTTHRPLRAGEVLVLGNNNVQEEAWAWVAHPEVN
jgi:hypothetical protein